MLPDPSATLALTERRPTTAAGSNMRIANIRYHTTQTYEHQRACRKTMQAGSVTFLHTRLASARLDTKRVGPQNLCAGSRLDLLDIPSKRAPCRVAREWYPPRSWSPSVHRILRSNTLRVAQIWRHSRLRAKFAQVLGKLDQLLPSWLGIHQIWADFDRCEAAQPDSWESANIDQN